MKNLFVLLSCFLLASCANNLHFEMPRGPQGLSAYELWVTEVKNGDIEWDSDQTDLNDFFRYLKGEKGDDGQSAYDLWVEQVKEGILNPHNPGENWPKDETGYNDFWRFLTGEDGKDGKPGLNGKDGKDGLSAWELWKIDVAKGLPDPHNPGENWSKDETSLEDFWEYLRGENGENGKGSFGETGKPGETIEVVIGVPNVIPLYQSQKNNEFVAWQDGSVTYQVYNNIGKEVGAGVTVKGMPGIDPNTEFTTIENGTFKIYKESLPQNKPYSERSGTAQVTYIKIGEDNKEIGEVTEPSANNIYVPEKVKVRLRVRTIPYLSGVQIVLSLIVERRTEGGRDWETIPKYLGDVTNRTIAYYAVPANDLTIAPDAKRWASSVMDISSTSFSVWLSRPTLECSYVTTLPTTAFNGTDHHNITFRLEDSTTGTPGFYGEMPQAEAVLLRAPIQYAPLPENIKMSDYNAEKKSVDNSEGTFTTSGINREILYNGKYIKTNDNGFDYYTPVAYGDGELDDKDLLSIKFTHTTSNEDKITTECSLVSLNSPDWKIIELPVYNNSSVEVVSKDPVLFRNSGSLGVLNLDVSIPANSQIKGTKGKLGTVTYAVPDIEVSFTPNN